MYFINELRFPWQLPVHCWMPPSLIQGPNTLLWASNTRPLQNVGWVAAYTEPEWNHWGKSCLVTILGAYLQEFLGRIPWKVSGCGGRTSICFRQFSLMISTASALIMLCITFGCCCYRNSSVPFVHYQASQITKSALSTRSTTTRGEDSHRTNVSPPTVFWTVTNWEVWPIALKPVAISLLISFFWLWVLLTSHGWET